MAEDLTEIAKSHAYWIKKLSAMQSKLDKAEQHRDVLSEVSDFPYSSHEKSCRFGRQKKRVRFSSSVRHPNSADAFYELI